MSRETKKLSNTSTNSIQLEELLRLKRLEKPREDFWQHFEQEFQRKRLQAAMRSSRRDQFLNFLAGLRSLKGLSASLATCGALLFAFYLGFNSPTGDSSATVPGFTVETGVTQPGTASPAEALAAVKKPLDWEIPTADDTDFVTNALAINENTDRGFSKEFSHPYMRADSSGVEYVKAYMSQPSRSEASLTSLLNF